jgi:hypothetical protein
VTADVRTDGRAPGKLTFCGKPLLGFLGKAGCFWSGRAGQQDPLDATVHKGADVGSALLRGDSMPVGDLQVRFALI